MLFLTLLLIIFTADNSDFFLKPELSKPEAVYLLAGVLISFFLMFVFSAADRHISSELKIRIRKHAGSIIALLSLLFFIAEVLYAASAFFYSDWDPAGVLDCVYKLLRGRSGEINIDYFSAHPNNLMLVCTYLSVLRTAGLFGTESVISIVILQALLFSLGGVLFFYIVHDLLSLKAAFLSYFLYVFWIGFNPYLFITYSDAVGLIFPLVILRLFQLVLLMKKGNTVIPTAAVAGVFAALGYAVKPQTVIVFIAGIIVTAFGFFLRKNRKQLYAVIAAVIVFPAVLITVNYVIYPSLGLELDKAKSFGFSHYIMMGLNPETDGVYSNEDTEFTNSIKDPSIRREENLRVTEERLKAYGLKGLLGHLKRKQLINFCDGTFSWGIDGNFFAGPVLGDMPAVREDSPFRPLIHSFIIAGERNYDKYRDLMQLFWLTVLFFASVGEIYALKRLVRRDFEGIPALYTLGVLFLSLYGLTVFELIFEAKARYLFTYLPLFLTAGVYGACVIYRSLRRCLKR